MHGLKWFISLLESKILVLSIFYLLFIHIMHKPFAVKISFYLYIFDHPIAFDYPFIPMKGVISPSANYLANNWWVLQGVMELCNFSLLFFASSPEQMPRSNSCSQKVLKRIYLNILKNPFNSI